MLAIGFATTPNRVLTANPAARIMTAVSPVLTASTKPSESTFTTSRLFEST